MYSQHPLHNPREVLPTGPPVPGHWTHSVNPLTSNRNAHITRLYSILVHLLSLPPSRETSRRIVRAWRALAGCKEVHLNVMWRTGTAVLARIRSSDDDDDHEVESERNDERADWLKFVQEGKIDKVDKFHEYILALVATGRIRFALDELESYLDNQPYHDSISLNTLSAQLSLLLAQPDSALRRPSHSPSTSSSSDDDDDMDAARSRQPQGGRANGKRIKVVEQASHDDDLLPYLRILSTTSPGLFSKAKERFKRAAELERQSDASSSGEAARWLQLIQRSEKVREDSPL
ncbi:uncharacterized protein JCM15063_006354 [Sporobolomyces koalae]|uniref:uncharacterized protein n=1 Tax=Sporobolomyces koalae TaxID=500713 RepID=UPI00317C01EF